LYIGCHWLIRQIWYKHASNRIFAHCLPRLLSFTHSCSSVVSYLIFCSTLSAIRIRLPGRLSFTYCSDLYPKGVKQSKFFFQSSHFLWLTKCAGSASSCIHCYVKRHVANIIIVVSELYFFFRKPLKTNILVKNWVTANYRNKPINTLLRLSKFVRTYVFSIFLGFSENNL